MTFFLGRVSSVKNGNEVFDEQINVVSMTEYSCSP